jgi:hypothetical protein
MNEFIKGFGLFILSVLFWGTLLVLLQTILDVRDTFKVWPVRPTNQHMVIDAGVALDDSVDIEMDPTIVIVIHTTETE